MNDGKRMEQGGAADDLAVEVVVVARDQALPKLVRPPPLAGRDAVQGCVGFADEVGRFTRHG